MTARFRWKLKCRELERDVDRVRHQAAQTTTRNEQLVQQLGLSQSQQGSGVQHVDKLKHELTQFVVSERSLSSSSAAKSRGQGLESGMGESGMGYRAVITLI